MHTSNVKLVFEITRPFRAMSVGRLSQMVTSPKYFSSTNDGTLCISVDAR